MARFLGRFLLMMLVVLPTSIMLVGNGQQFVVRAQDADPADLEEDLADGEVEDEEATVETEQDVPPEPGTETAATEGDKEEEEEEVLKPSENADSFIHFTKPIQGTDFPAGELVKFLVGFTNKGSLDFVVDSMEASFRYPQDYSFYIQNFTHAQYEKVVEPNNQATFEYAFTPSETFNARPFGLTINLNYRDSEGKLFQDAVFNDTINIVEADEGLDGETFFLYIFLAAIAVLLLVGAQQLLASFGKKRLSKPQPRVEMGTQNKGDVDYDWLPKETLEISQNKSPRRSPKQSPGRRRAKRSSGAAED